MNECVFACPLPNLQQFKEKQDEAELSAQLLRPCLVLHPGSSLGPGRLMAYEGQVPWGAAESEEDP